MTNPTPRAPEFVFPKLPSPDVFDPNTGASWHAHTIFDWGTKVADASIAAEREACAKVCDELAATLLREARPSTVAASKCADEIRARSKP